MRAASELGCCSPQKFPECHLECPFLMHWVYSVLLAISLIVSLPYWLLQMSRHGKYRTGLWQRLGRVPQTVKEQPGQRTIWVHAVSVGEVLAVGALVDELREGFPGRRIVVSTTTDTGQELARKRF